MIRLNGVCFSYPDGKKALYDISLEIQSGESVALIGGNGAGKSTLLGVLCGIYVPQNGSAEVCGVTVGRKTGDALRKKVGMVFQNPDEQLFMSTPAEDIGFGPQSMGKTPEEVREIVEQTAKRLGIEELAGRMSQKLSGGEKRLAAIGTVLACETEAVLFDEPLTYLDPKARSAVIKIINGMEGTKIIATHDLDMAMDICSRVVIMDGGRIAADGGAELLRNEELLKSCGLELPLSLKRCAGCACNKQD